MIHCNENTAIAVLTEDFDVGDLAQPVFLNTSKSPTFTEGCSLRDTTKQNEFYWIQFFHPSPKKLLGLIANPPGQSTSKPTIGENLLGLLVETLFCPRIQLNIQAIFGLY